MNPPIRRAVCLATALTSGLALALAAGSASSADLKRFPGYAYESDGEVDVEALKELLRRAREMQKLEDAAKVATDETTDAKKEEASPDAAPATPKAVAAEPAARPQQPGDHQAGCMYRGRKLIWERVSGTCKP